MMILVLLLPLAVAAIAGTIASVRSDGYSGIGTRDDFDTRAPLP